MSNERNEESIVLNAPGVKDKEDFENFLTESQPCSNVNHFIDIGDAL